MTRPCLLSKYNKSIGIYKSQWGDATLSGWDNTERALSTREKKVPSKGVKDTQKKTLSASVTLDLCLQGICTVVSRPKSGVEISSVFVLSHLCVDLSISHLSGYLGCDRMIFHCCGLCHIARENQVIFKRVKLRESS